MSYEGADSLYGPFHTEEDANELWNKIADDIADDFVEMGEAFEESDCVEWN
jgi:hypothetical protein